MDVVSLSDGQVVMYKKHTHIRLVDFTKEDLSLNCELANPRSSYCDKSCEQDFRPIYLVRELFNIAHSHDGHRPIPRRTKGGTV